MTKNTRKHTKTLKGKTILRKTQPTVKIDGGLNLELNNWLGTENAAVLGFHSKSDFVTEAVREFMQKIRGPRFTDLLENEIGDYTLIDTYLNPPEKFITITVDKKHLRLICNYCKIDYCDHILYAWVSNASSQRLLAIGFNCDITGKKFHHPI